jgi:hypothetical protein
MLTDDDMDTIVAALPDDLLQPDAAILGRILRGSLLAVAAVRGCNWDPFEQWAGANQGAVLARNSCAPALRSRIGCIFIHNRAGIPGSCNHGAKLSHHALASR